MKGFRGNAVSAQRKMIANTDKFSNAGIKKQQGTTRAIYDSLPLDGRTVFRFFEESNNRNFPLTNMGSDGNKLPVGNALAIERAYLSVVTIDPDTGDVAKIDDLPTSGLTNILIGELNIEIANSQVLKQVPVLSFDPRFNKNASNEDYNNFEFDTQLIINPLLEFVFPLKANTYVAVQGAQLRLTVEGTGAIISPRATF